MLFSIIVIIIVGLVAYFQYLQGFFSAALSAVFAIIAAVVAVGYHEWVVGMLLKGQFADQANAIAIVVLFAAVYIIPRLIFDSLVPGNVSFPLYVDRVGAGVAGVIAGIFVAGVFAIAAQSMPFGPGVAMLERYPINPTAETTIATRRRPEEVKYALLDQEAFLSNSSPSGLWVPADKWVLGFTSHLSSRDGSLSQGRAWKDVHPDYLQELFGQRVALQSGSKQAALADSVSFVAAFQVKELPQDDQERWEKRGYTGSTVGVGTRHSTAKPLPDPLAAKYVAEPERMLLVVRLTLGRINADQSQYVSFTPAGVRIVHKQKNHFPIGTLEDGKVLYRNLPDDVLFVEGDKAVDLVFDLPQDVLSGDEKSEARSIANGVFLELKRLAKVELAGKTVSSPVKPDKNVQVLRKDGTPRTPGAGETKSAAASPSVNVNTSTAAAPLAVRSPLAVTVKLPNPINVGTTNRDERNADAAWGKYSLTDRKFSKLEVDPVQTVTIMSRGEQLVEELLVPPGAKLMTMTAVHQGDKWAWLDAIGDFEAVDAGGKRHKPNGVYVPVVNDRGQRMLFARYDAAKALSSLAAPANADPTEITLYFLIPANEQIKSLDFKQQVLQAMNAQ